MLFTRSIAYIAFLIQTRNTKRGLTTINVTSMKPQFCDELIYFDRCTMRKYGSLNNTERSLSLLLVINSSDGNVAGTVLSSHGRSAHQFPRFYSVRDAECHRRDFAVISTKSENSCWQLSKSLEASRRIISPAFRLRVRVVRFFWTRGTGRRGESIDIEVVTWPGIR